nr:MAG TPA: hypothetical protein [Caudoviricetes sp.]
MIILRSYHKTQEGIWQQLGVFLHAIFRTACTTLGTYLL